MCSPCSGSTLRRSTPPDNQRGYGTKGRPGAGVHQSPLLWTGSLQSVPLPRLQLDEFADGMAFFTVPRVKSGKRDWIGAGRPFGFSGRFEARLARVLGGQLPADRGVPRARFPFFFALSG